MASTKQLADARSRVEAITGELEQLLGISKLGITVHHKFQESPVNDDDRIVAETKADWEYRQVSLRWFLCEIVSLDDADLAGVALHEYVHVLLAPMESEVPARFAKQCEFAVESMTLALQHAVAMAAREKEDHNEAH